MGLANIPMIVLFGPTNSKKFAPSKKNIKIFAVTRKKRNEKSFI